MAEFGTDKRKLLLLGGKRRLIPPVLKAKSLGLLTIVADGNPEAPAFEVADVAVRCDISDTRLVTRLATQYRVDGVLALSEYGVVPAAAARQLLGLPGITIEAARNATDKMRMRSAWQNAGLYQPRFRSIESHTELQRVSDEPPLPAVCKPCRSCASRGVSLVRRPDDLAAAVQRAQPFDEEGHVILEQFVAGTVLSCESMIVDGRLSLLAVAENEVQCDAHSTINWSLTYSPQIGPDRRRLEEVLNEAAAALQIDQGVCHGEVIVADDDIYLLEMAARGGGGHIYTTIVEHCSGFDIVSASIRHAMGEPFQVESSRSAAAKYEFLRTPTGRLLEVRGIDKARNVPWIHDVGLAVQPGNDLGRVRHGAERAGWIVALAETREQVDDAVSAARSYIEFVVETSPA